MASATFAGIVQPICKVIQKLGKEAIAYIYEGD